MRKSFGKSVMTLAFALVAGGASQVWADPISDSLTVYDGTGAIVSQATQGESNENAGNVIGLVGVAVDLAQFGNPTYLVEPGTGQFSDIFGIYNPGNGGPFELAFASDTENQSVYFGSFPRQLPENQASYSATMYLDPTLQALGWTAVFVSDPAPVPEPSTLALLGLGGIGLAIGAYRRRRAAAV